MLYQGTVDGMLSSEGFFELKSENLNLLKEKLTQHAAVENILQEEDKLVVHLKENLEAKDLNEYLFKNGIVLQHLVKRKNSLEEQFLELTKNK